MDILDIISIIGQAVTFIGVIFIVYNYFRNPQVNLEKEQAITDKELDSKASILAQKEMENKADILAKQFQWNMDANEKKFCEMTKKIEDAFLLALNHTHTVDTKVDKLIDSVNSMGLGMAKLSTIIEERIPKK